MYDSAMGATTTGLMTFDEFERMPEKPGKQELLNGELIELPPADYQHNTTSEEIFLRLREAVDAAHERGEANELGRVHMEMGYKLGDHWVQPDVSISFAAQKIAKYLEGAPAIAIEIVSPSNTAEALDIKTELCFEFGAREVWRFYPKTRHVTVQTADGHAVTVRENESVTTLLLPGSRSAWLKSCVDSTHLLD
jgi:Uma2 family endonuclease